jgi:DNA-binding response OmpR family regulator
MQGKIDLTIVDSSSAQCGNWNHYTPKLLVLVDASAHFDVGIVGAQLKYLLKPFTAEEILCTVRALLDCQGERKSS